MYAVTRYQDVRAVLDSSHTFISGHGVGLNDFINVAGRGTTLMSDGDEHQCQRDIIGRPLTPRALTDLRPEAQALADDLIDRLVEQQTFDAVTDLAEVLPATWVPDLLGWPEDGRDHLLDWGAAIFDGLGPLNARTEAAGLGVLEMSAYAQQLATSELPFGSFVAGIREAAARGEIEDARCPMMIADYLAPSLDTTISAIGNAIWLLATHPAQWQALREHPERVKSAFNEALRMETPISCFTRVADVDTAVDGVDIPSGSRVLVSFASANRDERRWVRPDTFDITRENAAARRLRPRHPCVRRHGTGSPRRRGDPCRAGRSRRAHRARCGADAEVEQPHPIVRLRTGHRRPGVGRVRRRTSPASTPIRGRGWDRPGLGFVRPVR